MRDVSPTRRPSPWLPRLTAAVLAAALSTATGAQPAKALWVLQPPDAIVLYDVPQCSPRRAVTVPPRCFEAPIDLAINAIGQMIFLPPAGMEWAGGELATASNRAWLDTSGPPNEVPEVRVNDGPAGGRDTQDETVSMWYLSATGDSLFLSETTSEKTLDDSSPGLERSVRSAFRVYRTDLAGGARVPVATLAVAGPCRCDTGVCLDTCPQWRLWAPGGVVGDFFLVTRFTEGQLQTDYQESVLYRHTGSRWRATKLPRPIERPLAASGSGDVLVAAVPDAGCCGAANDSSDQLIVASGASVSVVFDEWRRFGNQDYDVSIYPINAALAPGGSLLAYTLAATSGAGSSITVAPDREGNAAELARIRGALAELPLVAVTALAPPHRELAIIQHAALVGWLSDRELLVARDGRLVICDPHGVTPRETPIRVRTAADAFLR